MAGTVTFQRQNVAVPHDHSAEGGIRMKVLGVTCSLMLVLTAAQVFGQQGAPVPVPLNPSQRVALCKPGSLPSEIQNRLKEEYSSWKIQEPRDLSARAHARWEGEKPLECPGIAVGYFENAKMPSYAVLLVPVRHADAGYRFLVFSHTTGQSTYEVRVVEKWDESGAANYFIHRAPMSKFFDKPSRKKFQVHTTDGILLVDSAENEYEVDVYFWSGGSYRNQWLDY